MTGCRISSEDAGDPHFDTMEPWEERVQQRDKLRVVMDDIIKMYDVLIEQDSFDPCDELISDADQLYDWLVFESRLTKEL